MSGEQAADLVGRRVELYRPPGRKNDGVVRGLVIRPSGRGLLAGYVVKWDHTKLPSFVWIRAMIERGRLEVADGDRDGD